MAEAQIILGSDGIGLPLRDTGLDRMLRISRKREAKGSLKGKNYPRYI